MPRAKGENRGGARTGTPGKAYGNRTDLMSNYGPNAQNTAATGGTPAPSLNTGVETPPQGPTGLDNLPSQRPEDTPMLSDPTNRPDEPITAGLPVGPGPGPQTPQTVSPSNNLTLMKQYLPDLEEAATWQGAPPEFKQLVNVIRNS